MYCVCVYILYLCVCMHFFCEVNVLEKHHPIFKHINGCVFLCVRVVFRALSSLCVRRSVRECLTQHAYQETKQVTLERPTRISTQFKDDVLSSSQWSSVIKLHNSRTELVSLKQKKKRKPMTWVHVACINVNGCIKLNKRGMLWQCIS